MAADYLLRVETVYAHYWADSGQRRLLDAERLRVYTDGRFELYNGREWEVIPDCQPFLDHDGQAQAALGAEIGSWDGTVGAYRRHGVDRDAVLLGESTGFSFELQDGRVAIVSSDGLLVAGSHDWAWLAGDSRNDNYIEFAMLTPLLPPEIGPLGPRSRASALAD